MIVRCVTDVRCDDCKTARCSVEHDMKKGGPGTLGFAEPFSRLGWGYGPKASHLCPACFKKALTRMSRDSHGAPIVNGIMTVTPQP